VIDKTVIKAAVALASGLLFGVGVFIAGVSNPEKVLGFLDIFGAWDPSLALVMAGALSVVIVEFSSARGLDPCFVGEPFHWPAERPVDLPLVAGSILFGVGWGMTGFCPGASLVALGLGYLPAALFVASLFFGFMIGGVLTAKRRSEIEPY